MLCIYIVMYIRVIELLCMRLNQLTELPRAAAV